MFYELNHLGFIKMLLNFSEATRVSTNHDLVPGSMVGRPPFFRRECDKSILVRYGQAFSESLFPAEKNKKILYLVINQYVFYRRASREAVLQRQAWTRVAVFAPKF